MQLTAPTGYALDSSVQSFTVTAGQNTALSVSDTPTNDPAMITLNKVDSETGDMVQGGASLAGAQFTVNYYDGYYNNSNLPANPTRSWIIQTKEITTKGGNKVYRAVLSNDYFVAGDALYSASGINTLPLGTISIEETKAPEGYNLEGAYLQVGGTGTKITGKYVAQITQDGNLASLKGGNTFKVSDKIKRGDFKLTKIDTDNQNRMSDIQFRVTCKGTGESHIIKTDENGYFSSESSWNAQRTQTAAVRMTDCGFLQQMAVQRSMTRLELCLMVITHLRSFPVTTTGAKSSIRASSLSEETRLQLI